MDAVGLVKETVEPGHKARLEDARLACLDSSTLRALRNRRAADENTLDETVTRLLAESSQCRTLENFLRDYIDSRGRESVAQIVLHRPHEESGLIQLSAIGDVSEGLPDVVNVTDFLIVDGERFDFILEEDPYGPQVGENVLRCFRR